MVSKDTAENKEKNTKKEELKDEDLDKVSGGGLVGTGSSGSTTLGGVAGKIKLPS